uniref:E3 ubiquitin-protein ligase PRT1-like isoform X1 n=1 Tax=Tanacetum cinerariifolium TaxID=118510 RepID=A0A699JIY4_TANCI|nr:E3 ubiquitin-protein ligase PRT1-like isoform X1 [Tanacetum cinerariifolium]
MEESIQSEKICDNFICAICLDVIYKPIVLVCGHVSCFWCCQHSMRMRSESRCPLCQHPYHHFPAICLTLHFLLKKLYPVSYTRRKIQTQEDEKHSKLGPSLDLDSLVISEEYNVSQSSDINSEDASCVACKQLLFRPVVLNCGHVFCEACVTIPTEWVLKCQVCELRHPSGVPKVCMELDNFLEEQYSSEYALRRSSIQLNHEQTHISNSPNDAATQVSRLSFPTEENFLQWWIVHGSKYHDGVGCDMCGMYPIIGERYMCKDCTEKCSYDLCGDCYNVGSNLPGRFNQKHTSTHHLELVKPVINRNVIYRLLSGHLAAIASRSQSSPANTSPEFPSSSLDEDGVGSRSNELSSASYQRSNQ